jgi:integrase
MAKINLTDRFIASDKRTPSTGRKDYQDSGVPGLALRVTSAGHKSFVLVARYPRNPKNPTRRALGEYGVITLDDARQKARDWLALIQKGKDPKTEEARQRAAELRSQSNTFAHVAEEFLSRHAAKLAHAAQARRIVEAEFVRRWGQRPIKEILAEECAAAIRAVVKRGAPAQAHSAHEWLRRLFRWAIGTNEFEITASPVATLQPTDLIGRKVIRDRVLTNDELRAVWGACGGSVGSEGLKEARRRGPERQIEQLIGYPYGPLFKLLILTGQREREVADMVWSELNLDEAIWTIPKERMKGTRAHTVPLPPDALALLRSLPRFTAGNYVFSTTGGLKPVNGFSKAKARLDKLSDVTSDWVLHDLRRTARTHFSALPVQDMVRELVIAHARPGLHAVYDQHSYADEKRELLTLWENRLRGILSPKPPASVADLAAARAQRDTSAA